MASVRAWFHVCLVVTCCWYRPPGAHFPTRSGEYDPGKDPDSTRKCGMDGAAGGFLWQRALQRLERNATAELNGEPAFAGRALFHPVTAELSRKYSDVHHGQKGCRGGLPGAMGCLDCRHFRGSVPRNH
jgi:hypothetical protein